MIRPMQATDVSDVVSLLEWMDDRPEREVMAPEARAPHELRWESEDKRCVVRVDDLGQVRAYCALTTLPSAARHAGGLVLEGPLGEGPFEPLLRNALGTTRESVYAFCARDNLRVRDALEAAGFSLMHATDFYRLKRAQAKVQDAPLAPEVRLMTRTSFEVYRALYRSSEDAWSTRLTWSSGEFDEHCARDDVRLFVLARGRQALGFVELELAEVAQLTYLAVHPAERGRGYGAALLSAAVREAFRHPGVREVQARAHDHEASARRLYHGHGFDGCRAIVTYLREAEDI